jgi:hypothetical protein
VKVRLLLGVLAGVLGVHRGALAQQGRPPPTRPRQLSAYEQRTLNEVLRAQKAVVEDEPEGKIIEAIEVVPLDVIQPQDPAPLWLNQFHTTSRGYVIKREILLREGDAYRKVLLDESAKNLRALPQLSVASHVAVRGSAPGKVRVLFLTKDVWSLRGGIEVAYSQAGLEKMVLVPSESNVAGLHHAASLRYEGLPASYMLGARYAIPRLAGTRYYGAAEWNLIFNRASGEVEGHFGQLSAGMPLFASITPWSYGVTSAFRADITRRYVNAQVSTFDATTTPQDDRLPFEYRSWNHTVNLFLTRSYGWGIKHNVGVSLEGRYRAFGLHRPEGYDPRALEEFRRTKVPQTDHQVGPMLLYQTYSTDFVTILDYDTFGLQEDVRVGHDLGVRVYPVARGLGSSRDFVGMQLAASYTWPLGDGFARLKGDTTNEFTRHALTDGSLELKATVATPRLGFGRLIASINSLQRYRNYRTATSLLGGDTSLRGYPTSYFVGKDRFVYNFEFRSRPIEILTAQVGFALFHDVGDAYDGPRDFRARRSVGLGFRALFPQLSRMVLRADLALPLSLEGLPADVPPISFFVAFQQAFQLEPS